LIFGIPAVLQSSKQMADEGSPAWDYDEQMIHALVERKWDACIGSLFLAGGFLFQFIAAVDYNFLRIVAIALWVALPVLAALYLFARPRIVGRHAARVVALANSEE
jgi:hypothetical protein